MKNKEKILDIISHQSCGITPKKITQILGEQIDKTTVYRNLEKLLIQGFIIEDFTQTGEKKYSLCETHHHHFVCDICKNEKNIGCFFEKEIKILENQFGFNVKNHSFILNGVCEDCK